MIVCITAKADITQTAAKFTRWNVFAFPYPLMTHTQHMCSWGKSQPMQFYQRCHFITGAAHVEWQADPVLDWDAAQDQPAPGTEHSPAPPHRSNSHCTPAEQPQRHTCLCSSVLGTCQPHSCPFRGLGLGLDQQPSHWINTELCSSAGTMPAPVRIYQTAKA